MLRSLVFGNELKNGHANHLYVVNGSNQCRPSMYISITWRVGPVRAISFMKYLVDSINNQLHCDVIFSVVKFTAIKSHRTLSLDIFLKKIPQ
jgi:hypothetical protein